MENDTAELILRGGSVWTPELGTRRARALAVGGGRVLALGDDAQVDSLVGPNTAVVELRGRSLLPGFIDAHTHFISGGFSLAEVGLRDARTPAELAARIGDFAQGLAPGEWITGGEWDHENWGGALPTREWIDSVTPQNPVLVSRLDLHMALANTLALEAGGVTSLSQDPPGGTIVRDPATGEPTGILKDEAMLLVQRAIPDPGQEALDRALQAAGRHALSLGVTQIHDMGTWENLATYRRAHASGHLPLRVYSVLPLASWERLRDEVASHGRGDDRLWWGGVKGFVDGSLGSSTAWFHEPYADDPLNRGLTVTDPAILRERILHADAAGLHLIVHAIGDHANDWLLDTFREAGARNPDGEGRYRVEHAQHLTPEAIHRFGAQGVIASMQPAHAADDGRWAEGRIGRERTRRSYACRSLLDAGATLAFGSDWTVATLDPLAGVVAAVSRRTWDGSHPGGWVPEEKISLEETLAAYTRGAAYAGFREGRTGSLLPGAWADMVVLSDDIFAVSEEQIGALRVEGTWVAGVLAYGQAGR